MSEADLALAQFVAASTYGQLAGYSLTSSMIAMAPDIVASEELARLADREYDEYVILRTHLDELTDLAEGLLDRQRLVFDEFFAGATDRWETGLATLAFGWAIANDFLKMLAPRLPTATRDILAEVVSHQDVEPFAMQQLQAVVVTDQDRERMRAIVAELLGRALRGYQQAMQDTDALEVLLDDEERGVATRELAIDILANHRRRMAALGIDDPD